MKSKKDLNSVDMRDAFFDALYDIASKDKDVIFLTADMGAMSLERFRKDLKKQYFNVGVAEQNMISVAAGLALGGKKVFVYSIASFATQRCYEQIKVDLCAMNLPVTVVGVGPGVSYTSDGLTHHVEQDIAIMRALPNLTIISPFDSSSSAAAAYDAYKSKHPVYIRLDKGRFPVLKNNWDKADIDIRELKKGRDVIIVSTGVVTHHAFCICEQLRTRSIDAGVIDVYKIKPFDQDKFVNLIKNYKSCIVIEEHSLFGGLGGIVSECIVDRGLKIKCQRFALPDSVSKGYGDKKWLYKQLGLDESTVANSIALWLNSSPGTGKKVLSVDDFARIIGVSSDLVPKECVRVLDSHNFHYSVIDKKKQEEMMANIFKKLDAGNLSIAGKKKQPLWEKGWGENLNNFLNSKYNLDELVPKYYRPMQPCRMEGAFVQGADPNFEYNFFKVLRTFISVSYLKDKKYIYEFGCGPGHNLVALARQYPEKQLFGFDWARSAVRLLNEVAKVYKFNISGNFFDLFHPNDDIKIKSQESAIITMGALEQAGNDFEAFIQFVLRKRPDICINIEPLCELYDEDSLFDYVAIRHHRQRNLLGNYFARLQQLESKGRLVINKIQKVNFGGLMEDGWSYVVWRPSGQKH